MSFKQRLALAAYGFALRLLVPAMLARYWWRGRREPGYRVALGERLGFVPRQRPGALWLHAVSLGETRGACGYVTFEDLIPPENYGGVESPLGALGYSNRYRCYGVQLTLRAELGSADQRTSTPISATRRAVVQCGRFHPG